MNIIHLWKKELCVSKLVQDSCQCMVLLGCRVMHASLSSHCVLWRAKRSCGCDITVTEGQQKAHLGVPVSPSLSYADRMHVTNCVFHHVRRRRSRGSFARCAWRLRLHWEGASKHRTARHWIQSADAVNRCPCGVGVQLTQALLNIRLCSLPPVCSISHVGLFLASNILLFGTCWPVVVPDPVVGRLYPSYDPFDLLRCIVWLLVIDLMQGQWNIYNVFRWRVRVLVPIKCRRPKAGETLLPAFHLTLFTSFRVV